MSPVVQTPPIQTLVVEDEPETLEILSECCRRHGFKVAGARDGHAAIAEIHRTAGQFDAVVTDLNLPGADGFDVLRAARQANPSCYVVIITGYATIDSAVRAVREGAYDYLAKPFALGQLDVVLWRIRDRMTLEQENRQLLRQQAAGSRLPDRQPADLMTRLAGIEERLAGIEAVLRDKSGR